MTFTPEQIANGKTWIAALRSGDYRQGRYALKHCGDNGLEYCCLGVAVDLFGLSHPESVEFIAFNDGLNCLGLGAGDQQIFQQMNDTGCSFPYIADRLEEFYGLTENAV